MTLAFVGARSRKTKSWHQNDLYRKRNRNGSKPSRKYLRTYQSVCLNKEGKLSKTKTAVLRRWGVLQNNLALSIGLIMWIGHRKEILKLTFRAFRPSSERIDASTRPSLSDCRSVCLSVCLSICLSSHLPLCLSFSLSVYQSVSSTFPYPRTEKYYLQFLFSFVQFYCCLVISRQITELILPTGKHAMRFVLYYCIVIISIILLFCIIAGSTRTLGQVKGAV